MQEQFKQFNATSLFCPKCNVANPVRERLLLVLPDGDLMDYVCVRCGTSVGKRKTTNAKTLGINIPFNTFR